MALSKQEEGLKALENAKDIQNKFDKKGEDIHNRLLDVIKREENLVIVSIVPKIVKIIVALFERPNLICRKKLK